MEIKPQETLKTVLETSLNVGRFVVDRLLGGGWADLPAIPQSAAIHYFPDRPKPTEPQSEQLRLPEINRTYAA